jgi:hypothetical protein
LSDHDLGDIDFECLELNEATGVAKVGLVIIIVDGKTGCFRAIGFLSGAT